jgi:hypothetical protein
MSNFDLRKYLTEGRLLKENKEIDVKAIKDEMNNFYGLNISDEDVNDWLEVYHYDRLEDDPDYDGNFEFDTAEREDFHDYLTDNDE